MGLSGHAVRSRDSAASRPLLLRTRPGECRHGRVDRVRRVAERYLVGFLASPRRPFRPWRLSRPVPPRASNWRAVLGDFCIQLIWFIALVLLISLSITHP